MGVAVSGGADSVVLLHILHQLSAQLKIEPVVLHVNHQLRGAESNADEHFVRSLAQSLGLHVLVEQAPLGEGNLEQAARTARRTFFKSAMERGVVTRVALGHTKTDQTETVLFRLLRGTGLTGLAGMRIVNHDGFIRPLLTTGRNEVREWAQSEGIAWREDSSNDDLRFSRNRLRLEVIPQLAKTFNNNLEEVLAGTANVAQAEEDYWAEQIEPIYSLMGKRTHFGLIFDVSELKTLHLAVQRRLIRRALLALRGNLRAIDLRHIEAILNLCKTEHGHDRVIIPGVDVTRSFGKLRLTVPECIDKSPRRHYYLELVLGQEQELPFHAGWIYVNFTKRPTSFCANFKGERDFTAEVVELDGEALSGTLIPRRLYVRNWEPGDEFQRVGHKSCEKIKTLFQEHRVSIWERRHWPVVVAGDEIVWVRSFGTAAKFAVSPSSRQVVRLVYRPAND
jgi:tRNA(Ile)-lysidine synthase